MSDETEVANQEWAQRVRGLSTEERDQRLTAVNALLAEPGDISDPLENELYILQEQLTAQTG